jgi:hypothetical protein
MHKTGACLPKQWQADPLVQALVLDPGLSKCNEHVCHDYAGFNNIMLKEEKLS